jgi:hypothetical protein
MDLLGWLVTSPNRRSMRSIRRRKRRLLLILMVVEEQSSSYRCFPETERQLSEPLKIKSYLKLKDCVHWMAPSVGLPFPSRQPVVAGEGPIGMWSSWNESVYVVRFFCWR